MERQTLKTGCELVLFPSFQKWDGYDDHLIIAEVEASTGKRFDAARRVYWVVNLGDEVKDHGGHYHPEGGKQEILVCLGGTAHVKLVDASGNEDIFDLNDPRVGLVVVSGVWHQLSLEPDTILLSIASTNYASDEAVTEKP